jgi:predicted RNase H-like HicB family nuclease
MCILIGWQDATRCTVNHDWAVMLRIESEREEDGRWIAEISALPGVLAYGMTEAEARAKIKVLALRVIADRVEHGEPLKPEDL